MHGRSTLLCKQALIAVAGLLVPGSVLLSGILGTPVLAQTPNTTVNFQARVLNSNGSLVPDGDYHVEFKLYSASTADGGETPDQGACTVNVGTADEDCLWTETRSTGNLVRVVNGYMAVNLGSVTAFSGSIPWGQNLYVTIRVGGTSGPTWDTEMTNSGTRMKLSAVPVAFTAGTLTKIAGSFTSTLELATPTSNRTITAPDASGTICLTSGNCAGVGGTGDILQGGNSFGSAVTIGSNDAYGLNLEVSGTTVAGFTGTGNLTLQPTANSSAALRLLDASGNSYVVVDTSGSSISLLGSQSRGISISTSSGGTSITRVGSIPGGYGNNNGQIQFFPGGAQAPEYPTVYVQGTQNSSIPAFLINQTGSGYIFDAVDNAVSVFNVNDGGAVTARNSVDSVNAFRVQNSAGTATVFNVDTTNRRVGINTSSPTATLEVNELFPNAPANIRVVYNDGFSTRYIEVAHEGDSTGSFIRTSTGGASAGRLTLSAGASTSALVIEGSGATTLRNNTNSGSALRVLNAAGTTTVFNVDTTSGVVSIGGPGDCSSANHRTCIGAAYIEFNSVGGNVTSRITQGDNSQLSFGTGSSGQYRGVRLQAPSNGLETNGYSSLTVAGSSTQTGNIVDIINFNSNRLLSVNQVSQNLIANNSIETVTTSWSASNGATLTQNTSNSYDGNASLSVATTAVANDGARYAFTTSASTQYTLSFYAKVSTGSMSTLQAGYTDDGTTQTTCSLSSATVTTTWGRYICTFTTGGSLSGSRFIFIRQSDAAARTIYVDAVQLETASSATPFNPGGQLQFLGTVSSPMNIRTTQAGQTGLTITTGNIASTALQLNAITGQTANIVQWNGITTGYVAQGGIDTRGRLFVGYGCGSANTGVCLDADTANAGVIRISSNGGSLDSTIAQESNNVLRVTSALGTVITTSNGSATSLVVTNASSTGNILNLQDNVTSVLSVSDGGAFLSKNSTNSTGAFQVQSSGSATPIFNVDTTNSRVGIGTATPTDTLQVATGLLTVGTGGCSGSTNTHIGPGYVDLCYVGGNIHNLIRSDTGNGIAVDLDDFNTVGNYDFRVRNGANTVVLQVEESGTIALGLSGTTATFSGNLTVSELTNLNGNTTIGNASTDRLTLTSQLLGASPIVFQGATDDSFVTTFAIADPTANNSITIPDASGTICLTSGNCVGVGGSGDILNNGQSGQVRIGSNNGNSTILETNNTDRLTILSNGNIGIGTSVPNNKLEVVGDGVSLKQSGGNVGIIYRNSSDSVRAQIGLAAGGGDYIHTTIPGDLAVSLNSQKFVLSTNQSTPNLTINTQGSSVFRNTTNSTGGFQVLNSASSSLFNVDTLTTQNLITNGDIETSVNSVYTSTPTFGWSTNGSATLSQNTSNAWQGNASLSVATTALANDGAKYDYLTSASTQYTLSFYAKVSTGSMATLQAGYSDDGTTQTTCFASATVTTTWARYSCTFTTGGSVSGSRFIFIRQSDATARTIYLDGIQLETGATATPFNPGGQLQLLGNINSPVSIRTTQAGQTGLMVSTGNAASTALTISGVSGQTADLFSVTNGGGAGFQVNASGRLQFNRLPGGNNGIDYAMSNGSVGGLLRITNGNAIQFGNINGISNGAQNEVQFVGPTGTSIELNSNGAYLLQNTNSFGSNFAVNGLATPAFTTASTGTNYYYVVTAVSSNGETVASPSLGMATNIVSLTWTPVPGATSYRIYRNTVNSFTSGSLLQWTGQGNHSDFGGATSAGLPPTAPTGTSLVVKSWENQSGKVFEVQNSAATALFTIGSTGTTLLKSATNSTTAFQVQQSGSTTPVLNVDTTNARVGIGTTTPGTSLDVVGAIRSTDGTSTGTLNFNTLSLFNSAYNRILTLSQETTVGRLTIGDTSQFAISLAGSDKLFITDNGNVGIGQNSPSTARLEVGSVTGTTIGAIINNGTSTGNILNLQDNGTNVFTLADGGAVLAKNSTNSTTAFQVQNAASVSMLTVDTTNRQTKIGSFISHAYCAAGGSTCRAWAPNIAAYNILGDIDLRANIILPDWTPAAGMTVIQKDRYGDSFNSSYAFAVNTNGTILMYWNTGSVFNSVSSTIPVPAVDGAAKWVRATLDVNNGASGHDVTFYISDDGISWTQLGTTVTNSGVTNIAAAGLSSLNIGSGPSGSSGSFGPGTVYRAIVKNGINGSTVADFYPAQDAVAPTDTTLVSPVNGETWTLGSNMSFIGTTGLVVAPTSSTFGNDVILGGKLSVTGNAVIGAGSSLTVVGGATTSRPGSPTEGMIYFDTTTKQLLTYANGKWQADRSNASKIVAANNSPQAIKDGADYVASGTNDHTVINTAIDAVVASGGTVYLTEGTFNIGGTISIKTGVNLVGAGDGTVVTIPNSLNPSSITFIQPSASGTHNVKVANMRLNGNDTNNTVTTHRGINTVGSDTYWVNQGIVIEGITFNDFQNESIYVDGNANVIRNNKFYDSGNGDSSIAIYVTANGFNSSIVGNYINQSGRAIVNYADNILISANKLDGWSDIGDGYASVESHGANVAISANYIYGSNYGVGVLLSGATSTSLTGNQIYNGVNITASSTRVSVSGNAITGLVSMDNTISNISVTGNTIAGSAWVGIYMAGTGVNVSDNNISAAASAIFVAGVSTGSVSNNTIYNSGASSANSGIFVGYFADPCTNVSIVANTITDTAGTGHAIEITASATDTYVADNVYSGTGATTLSDSGVRTRFASQMTPSQILQSGSSLIRANSSTVITGSIDPAASTAVVGVGTLFTEQLQVGDRITVSGETRTVTVITDNLNLTVDSAFSNNANDTSVDRLPASLKVTSSAGSTQLVVADNGNIGIGTASPEQLLTLAAEDPYVRFNMGSTSTDLGGLLFYRGGAHQATIGYSNGIVLNGVTSGVSINAASGSGILLDITGTSANPTFAIDSTNGLTYEENNINQLQVNLSRTYIAGNLGVGQTNPTTARLEVRGGSGTTIGAIINNGTSTGNILNLQDNGTNILTVADTGAVLAKNSTNSTSAFQVQPSGSTTPVLNVDTTNSRVGIGTATPNYRLEIAQAAQSATEGFQISGGGGLINLYNSTGNYNYLDFDSAVGNIRNVSGNGLLALSAARSISLTTSTPNLADITLNAGGTGNDVILQTNGITRLTVSDTNDAYFGNGVTNATPSAFILQGTGGLGTNIAGANLTIAGGRGTGTGVGGNVVFQYAPAGGSGSSLNALQTACSISGTNGSFSCSGTGSNSERFGAGATAGGTSSLAVGYNASVATGATNSLAVGASSSITGSNGSGSAVALGAGSTAAVTTNGGGTALGAFANAGAGLNTGSVAVGLSATSSGSSLSVGKSSSSDGSNIAIGEGATASTSQSDSSAIALGAGATATTATINTYAMALGFGANATFNNSIALGRAATTTATNQLVIGSTAMSNAHISDVYIGNGVTAASPTGFTLQGTGGLGTDIAGANTSIAGGRGTGTGVGGSVLLRTAAAGSTGTSLNSLVTRLEVQSDGDVAVDTNTLFVDATNNRVGIGTASPTYGKLEVRSTLTSLNDSSIFSYANQTGNGTTLKNNWIYTDVAPTTTGTNSTFVGSANDMYASGTNFNSSSVLRGYASYTDISGGSSTSIGGVWSFTSSIVVASGTTIDSARGFTAFDPEGTGAITNNYGFYVGNQTKGSNDYGIYIQGADTYALWIDAGDARFDGNILPGTASSVDIGSTTLEVKDIYVADDTGIRFGLDQDALLAYDETTDDRVELTGSGASLFIEDKLAYGVQTLTLTDDGTANDDLVPTSSYVRIDADETANGGVPNLTISETGAKDGQILVIINHELDATNDTFTITNSAGVVHLPGGTTLTLGPNDSITLMYVNDRWITTANSNN